MLHSSSTDRLLRSSIILHRETDWIESGCEFEAEQMFGVILTRELFMKSYPMIFM